MSVVVASACAPMPATEVHEAELESGAAIASIAAPRGNSVVLVVSPADCLSCDVDLARWTGPGRDTSVPVAVVLTRAPTDDEARAITLLRVPVAGRVAKRALRPRIDAPCVLEFTDGKAVTSRCASGEDATGEPAATAALTLLDSTLIREDATAYVARPTHFAYSARHGHFITDAFSRNVLQLRPDGAIAGSIGRRGRGPGEFEAPSTVLVVRDSLLLIADQVRGGVVVRDIAGGNELGLIPIEGNRPTMVMLGDTVFAGTANGRRGTVLARWTVGGDPVRYFGTLPAAFVRSPHNQFIRNVSMTAWRDTLAYVVGLSEVVFVATSDGTVRDSIVVPRVRRRGVPNEVKLASFRDPAAVTAGSSVPWAIGALRDGRIAVVFADGKVRANAFEGRLFATVLARGRGTTCTDIPVPSDGHDLPRITFDGDHMLVLEQRVVGGKAVSVIRRYEFAPHCVSGAPAADA